MKPQTISDIDFLHGLAGYQRVNIEGKRSPIDSDQLAMTSNLLFAAVDPINAIT